MEDPAARTGRMAQAVGDGLNWIGLFVCEPAWPRAKLDAGEVLRGGRPSTRRSSGRRDAHPPLRQYFQERLAPGNLRGGI